MRQVEKMSTHRLSCGVCGQRPAFKGKLMCRHVDQQSKPLPVREGSRAAHCDSDLAATSAMRRSWLAAAWRTAAMSSTRTRGFLSGAAAP